MVSKIQLPWHEGTLTSGSLDFAFLDPGLLTFLAGLSLSFLLEVCLLLLTALLAFLIACFPAMSSKQRTKEEWEIELVSTAEETFLVACQKNPATRTDNILNATHPHSQSLPN